MESEKEVVAEPIILKIVSPSIFIPYPKFLQEEKHNVTQDYVRF
jgi:hypothetical protein